jgi:hypothetical protein
VFGIVGRYKISTQKSVALCIPKMKQAEKEIRTMIPFTIALKE